jgi:signal transduction histidine kinase
VAHELKTPITGIRAATEVLLDDDDEMPKDLRQRFLENMLNDSDRLSRLIHSILDFEKLSTGRAHLNIAKHNIRETIKKSLDSLSQLAAKKNVQLWCTNKSDYYLKYDEDRILQVFTNLISNALKFTEPAKGNIYIQYKYDNGYLEIQVSDNGKGIPDEDLPYVFDKFYQSKDQNTKKPHGSGLGLAISKQIIDNHGGKIWVENNAKTGATFSFTLPFVK